MTNKEPKRPYSIGMIGLGIMGRNLLLNISEHDFTVAGCDKDAARVVEALRRESKERDVRGAADSEELVVMLSYSLPTKLTGQDSSQGNIGPSGQWIKKSDRPYTYATISKIIKIRTL